MNYFNNYMTLAEAKAVYNVLHVFAVGFNTPPLAAVKLWQRLEFMVLNPTRTKNFLYKKNPRCSQRGFFIRRGRHQGNQKRL
jgi:hypothetical protein